MLPASLVRRLDLNLQFKADSCETGLLDTGQQITLVKVCHRISVRRLNAGIHRFQLIGSLDDRRNNIAAKPLRWLRIRKAINRLKDG